MTSVEAFLDEIRTQPVADGFGLIFVDPRRRGRQIIQVDNPRFMWNMPIMDMQRCRRLLIISAELNADVVAELNAQPIETMRGWYRYAMWDENHVWGD